MSPTPDESGSREQTAAKCEDQSTWRRRAGGALYAPEAELLILGGVSHLTAVRGTSLAPIWMWNGGAREDVRGSTHGLSGAWIFDLADPGPTQAFSLVGGHLVVANRLYGGVVDVVTGEDVLSFGGRGQFEIAWEPETIEHRGAKYTTTKAGVEVVYSDGTSELLASTRMLACEPHDVIALLQPNGDLTATRSDGTSLQWSLPATGYTSLVEEKGELLALTIEGDRVTMGEQCWELPDKPVTDAIVTPSGIVLVEGITASDGTISPRYTNFFAFPEPRDLAPCRWVGQVPRLIDLRPGE